MYRHFYNLSRYPFELNPDPYFFQATSGHKEVLVSLVYGIQRHKGFVAVTGEVGTGKTLLVHCLLELLRRTSVSFVYVINPRQSSSEFINYLLQHLRLPPCGASKGEGLSRLYRFLVDQYRRGLTCALVVDEAHLLSWELLEEIRLLGNLETTQQKLLQIVLVGQPELDRKLDSHRCRQVKQRLSVRCQLSALNQQETEKYIVSRLELAGTNSAAQELFAPDAIAAIYDYSQGIPRVVNTICENALIAGYSCQARRIGLDLIQEVSSGLHLPAPFACKVAA